MMQFKLHSRAAALATIAICTASAGALAESRAYNELADFYAIEVSAGVNVEAIIADTQGVVADARNQRALDHLEVTVRDGTLIISRDTNLLDFILDGGLVGSLFGGDNAVSVRVSATALIRSDVSSGADLKVTGVTADQYSASSSSGADLELVEFSVDNIELSSSSGADLDASGTCTNLNADASSGADLDAADLVCSAGNLSASSGSDLSAHITDGVSADVSSGAGITIYGDPSETDFNRSSGGDIRLRD